MDIRLPKDSTGQWPEYGPGNAGGRIDRDIELSIKQEAKDKGWPEGARPNRFGHGELEPGSARGKNKFRVESLGAKREQRAAAEEKLGVKGAPKSADELVDRVLSAPSGGSKKAAFIKGAKTGAKRGAVVGAIGGAAGGGLYYYRVVHGKRQKVRKPKR